MCEEDKDIFSIVHNGDQYDLPHPMKAKDVRCPRCNGSRGVYVVYGKGWTCADDECLMLNAKKPDREEKRANINLLAYGFPVELENANLVNCKQNSVVLKALCEFAKDPKDFLILEGMNGTGKTYASACLARKFLEAGNTSCQFIKTTELYYKWLESKENHKSDLYFVNKYSEYKLLIVDDIGTKGPSESFLDLLFLIFDKRKHTTGTVLTTNLNEEEFEKKFTSAVASRVWSNQSIFFEGFDRRSIHQKKYNYERTERVVQL